MKIDYHHLNSVPSTNTWAKSCAGSFDRQALTVITADEQTEGRGRQERRWLAQPGASLTVSFCFFVPKERQDLPNVAQVVGVAAAEAVANMPLQPRLKWPNDLLLDGKKLGGILCETKPMDTQVLVVAGLGLNVDVEKEVLQKADQSATSLKEALKTSVDLLLFTQSVVSFVHQAIELYLQQGFTPFLERYRAYLTHKIGDTIRFHHGTTMVQGTFLAIGEQGQLDLIIDEMPTTFHSGEIV